MNKSDSIGKDNLSIHLNSDSIKARATIRQATFLDSISAKAELSVDQVRKYTKIDSIYYTGMFSDASFSGDTVFNCPNGLRIMIIDYDDRKSCIYRFLLVIVSANHQNIDNKIIYTDCDHDEGANYTTLKYRLINDSIFETIETNYAANSKSKVAKDELRKFKWKISGNGQIKSIP